MKRLKLSDAIKEGKLKEFAAQEESRGVEPLSGDQFDKALKLIIKPPQSAGRTSRSPSRGGSGGK